MGIVTDAEFRKLNPYHITGGVRFWLGGYGFGYARSGRVPCELIPTVWHRSGRVTSAKTWLRMPWVMFRIWWTTR